MAETYHANIPFGYISRRKFRESEILAAYVKKHIPSLEIPEHDFSTGNLYHYISELGSFPHVKKERANGSNQAAGFIVDLL